MNNKKISLKKKIVLSAVACIAIVVAALVIVNIYIRINTPKQYI